MEETIFDSNWIHEAGRTESNTPTKIVIYLTVDTVTFTREDNVIVKQSPAGVTVYQQASDGMDLAYGGGKKYRRIAYYANPPAIDYIYQN